MHHICGCYLAWGIEIPPHSPADRGSVALFAKAEIERFLRVNHAYPCPIHGSASGKTNDPLQPGERRFIPGSNAWYTTCPPDSYEEAEERGRAVMALGSLMYYPDGSMKGGPGS